MAIVSQPLLFLDVDGVLNPTAGNPPPGFVTGEAEGFSFSFSDAHRRQLTAIASDFEIVWATTWGFKANDSIGPALGLHHLDAVDLSGPRHGETWKLRAVARHASDRPLVWIDDELHTDAFKWAEHRDAPTLLIRPNGSVGLRQDHFDQIRHFDNEVSSTSFDSDFGIVLGPELPGDGRWPHPFFEFDEDGKVSDTVASPWGPPMLIEVEQLVDGSTWVGQFPGRDGLTAAVATPDPYRLCAISGGQAWIVDVRQPSKGARLVHSDVMATVNVADPALLLLVGYTHIVALGSGGVAWDSGQIASDDLAVVSTSNGLIECTAFVNGTDRTLTLSATTGDIKH